ncbi:MAG: hypothetical protein V1755_10500 [Chloroflexota bacterium]
MTENHTKGEMHGCIVCGRLYKLYVVYGPSGRFMDSIVMSAGGKRVPHPVRPLVACEHHGADQIRRAVERIYGENSPEEDT